MTKPNVERIEKSEINLADCIDDLMKTALETAEVITVGHRITESAKRHVQGL